MTRVWAGEGAVPSSKCGCPATGPLGRGSAPSSVERCWSSRAANSITGKASAARVLNGAGGRCCGCILVEHHDRAEPNSEAGRRRALLRLLNWGQVGGGGRCRECMCILVARQPRSSRFGGVAGCLLWRSGYEVFPSTLFPAGSELGRRTGWQMNLRADERCSGQLWGLVRQILEAWGAALRRRAKACSAGGRET